MFVVVECISINTYLKKYPWWVRVSLNLVYFDSPLLNFLWNSISTKKVFEKNLINTRTVYFMHRFWPHIFFIWHFFSYLETISVKSKSTVHQTNYFSSYTSYFPHISFQSVNMIIRTCHNLVLKKYFLRSSFTEKDLIVSRLRP